MKSLNLAVRCALTCIVANLSSSAAWASDSQLWTGGSAIIKLSDRWSVSQDVTARFSDKRGGLYEIEANTMVGFQLTRTLSLWAGYDHDPQYSNGHRTVMEHRFVQHLMSNDLGTLAGGNSAVAFALSNVGARASAVPAGVFARMSATACPWAASRKWR